jgi:hypothetical protein
MKGPIMETKNRSEKGQALILIAFAIMGIVALVALGMDSAQTFVDRRHAQNAVDAAALASAFAWSNSQNYVDRGITMLAANGYDGNNTVIRNVTAADTNKNCPDGTTGKIFTVELKTVVNMWFAQILGVKQINNTVTAVSISCKGPKVRQPLYPGNSVVSLSKASCNGASSKSLLVNGSGQLQVWGGGMFSNSTDPNCVKITANTQIKPSESDPKFCSPLSMAAPSGTLSGVQYQDNCGPTVYNRPSVDPPDDILVSCPTVEKTATGATATPGTYTGTFPNTVTHLEPGLYCLKGQFKMNNNQKLSGTGVTIVLLESGVHWNGSMELDLRAPTYMNTPNNQQALANGAISGLLIYSPMSNPSNPDVASQKGGMELNGSGNVYLQGTVLAPGTDCFYAGSGQVQKSYIQFICNTWQETGNADIQILYEPGYFYTPTSATTIALIK